VSKQEVFGVGVNPVKRAKIAGHNQISTSYKGNPYNEKRG
jgi:hypothetical protein